MYVCIYIYIYPFIIICLILTQLFCFNEKNANFLFEKEKKGREFNGLEISLYQDRIRDKGYTRIKLKQIKNRRIKAPKPISNS